MQHDRKNYARTYIGWFVCLELAMLLTLGGCASGAIKESSNTELNAPPATLTASNATNGLQFSDIELGLLSDLVGVWSIQDWQLRKDGTWQRLNGAQWRFSAIQAGKSLQDEWMSFQADGRTPSGFAHALRVFDPSTQAWQASWLSSNTGKIQHLDGLEIDNQVIFTSVEKIDGRLTRNVFSDIQLNSFAWTIEWSRDAGQTWLPVYRVKGTRKIQ